MKKPLLFIFSFVFLFFSKTAFDQQSDITLLWVPTYNNPLDVGCNGNSNDTIRVTVQNQGPGNTNFGDEIYVYYQVNNGPIVIDSLAFLANGSTWSFGFSNEFVDLSECDSTYQIKTWVAYANDTNNTNDTLSYTYTNYCSVVTSGGTVENDSIYYSVWDTDTIWSIGYQNATDFQWQYSNDSFNWSDVGNNADFHVVSFIDTIGWYRVLLSNPACPEEISDTVVIRYQDSTLYLNEFNEIQVEVYPNPFSDYIIVSSVEKVKLNICDLMGRQLESITIDKGDNKIPSNHFPKGKYLLQFQTKNGSKVIPLIKAD